MTYGIDLFGVGTIEEVPPPPPPPEVWVLPGILVAGYGITPIDQTIRTDMEAGRPRVRRRTTAREDQLQVQWNFSLSDMASFRAWFDNDIYGGSAWFPLEVITDGISEVKNCRFIGAWSATFIEQSGGRFMVKAVVEVEDA